jgi:protein-ribulosamine 3-kinase
MALLQNLNSRLQIDFEDSLTKKIGESVEIQKSIAISGGCINNASKITTNVGVFFLKWNSHCQADMFVKEEESLNELKKAAGNHLIIPEVFAAKMVNNTPGFLVLEYLPKRSMTASDEEKLGRGLAFIHKYSNKKFGFYSNNYCGATLQNNEWTKNWIEFFRDKRLRFILGLIQQERPLANTEIKIFDRLLDRIPKLIREESKPVLIHGDLWSGNFMIAENGPALIDPASYYADREMEMAIMTMFGGFSTRFFAAYNEVNLLPPDWIQRNKLYQLYHILNHHYLFGGGYKSQALAIAKSYL